MMQKNNRFAEHARLYRRLTRARSPPFEAVESDKFSTSLSYREVSHPIALRDGSLKACRGAGRELWSARLEFTALMGIGA